MVGANSIGEAPDLVGLEMIDGDGYTGAPKIRHELCRVFNRLGAVVLGSCPSRAAARTQDRCAGFAQRGSDATTGAARGAGDHRDTFVKGILVESPLRHFFLAALDLGFTRSGSFFLPVSRFHSSKVSGEIFPSTSSSANFRRCAWLLNGIAVAHPCDRKIHE